MANKINRATAQDIARNKAKQRELRAAGYKNVPLDGSWGKWQEGLYRQMTQSRNRQSGQKKAAVGVMALPIAGYGISQVLQGLGSAALPTVSGSAAAMTAPVALTLAGPAYGLYELATGQSPQVQVSPQQRQAKTYASDATRVSRPPIAVRVPRAGSQAKSKDIAKIFVSDAAARRMGRAINLAEEAATDSISPGQQATAEGQPVSGQQPNQDNQQQENNQNENQNQENSQEPQQGTGNTSNQNQGPKKSITDRLKNIFRNRAQEKTQTPSDPNGFWKTSKRFIWETGKNNFGSGYGWRNAGRLILQYPILKATGDGDYWTGVGYTIGNTFGGAGNIFEGIGKGWSKATKGDSTYVSTPAPQQQQQTQPQVQQSQQPSDTAVLRPIPVQQTVSSDSVQDATIRNLLQDSF